MVFYFDRRGGSTCATGHRDNSQDEPFDEVAGVVDGFNWQATKN